MDEPLQCSSLAAGVLYPSENTTLQTLQRSAALLRTAQSRLSEQAQACMRMCVWPFRRVRVNDLFVRQSVITHRR